MYLCVPTHITHCTPGTVFCHLCILCVLCLRSDIDALARVESQQVSRRRPYVKAAGFGLFCYTVNTPERARTLFGWGVDGLCTDRIDLIGPAFY